MISCILILLILGKKKLAVSKTRVSCPRQGEGDLQSTLPPLATPMRMVESESHNVYVRQACCTAVRKTPFKMNRAFKVIQGHPYWCRQESRMVCFRNVQLMPTLFLKLTKIRQRENGKFVDFNDLTQV